jgi:hypothetical protein
VGLRIDVRVDAQANGQRPPELLRDALDDIELLNVLDVQPAYSRFGGRRDLFAPLADTAVHDVVGREPGLEGTLHFAQRHDVCAAPLRGEPRQHGQIAVGLDGVGDQVRGEGQGFVDRAVCIVDRSTRVHERGRVDLRCDRLEWDVFAYERTVSIGEPWRLRDVHVGHRGPLCAAPRL